MKWRPVVLSRAESVEVVGPQGQALTALVTRETANAVGISAGFVRMPPSGISRVHLHAYSEIVVTVLSGSAATIVWECGQPRTLFHAADEMCYVPPGVPHCAVNLSAAEPVTGLEFRTDPDFNADVVLSPELQARAVEMAMDLQCEPV
jgi:uncharacterized RmlC-like cupin family protein